HPPRLESGFGRGEVPPGPVLPAERLHYPPVPFARAGRRPAALGAALPAALQPGTGSPGAGGCPRRAGALTRLLLAGQHSRAAERPQAGPAAGERPGSAPGLPARALGRAPSPLPLSPGGRSGRGEGEPPAGTRP